MMIRTFPVHASDSMIRRTTRAMGALLFFAVAPLPAASAQGTISMLGFGYPVGSGSTRVNGTAGAFAEFDALTPSNPASLGGVMRTVIGVQAEPELRTLTFGGVSERNTLQRVPLLMLVLPAGRGVAIGLSGTSFLDRSYSTITTGNVLIDGNTVTTNDVNDVRGAIGDLRAAAGWRVNTRLRVGVAGHLFTGEHIVARERTFADSLQFGTVLDSSRVTFFGTALSLGGEVAIGKGLAAMASFRKGNGLDSRIRDTVRTAANVPDRFGAGLRYDGIAGSVFAVSMEQVGWSKMSGLGSDQFTSNDAMNYRAGAEVSGPRLRGSALLIRAGFARNDLPFGIVMQRVRETRLSAGIGLPIARDDASLDLSIQRANRTLVGGTAKEAAWLLGIGIQVRP